ncbi:MAG: twin-arginine translocation pathway signal [Cyanobacteria bacterium K_DeepCast_35m_m2_023]|nr:twin-arginine translocation pathway signal [Cyanobacteria bacterium K_DeepCast_35m_m2_023]
MLTRRQLLRRTLGAGAVAASSALPAGLLSACSRTARPTLLSVQGAMPQVWLKTLPQPWQRQERSSADAIVAAIESGQGRAALAALSDGWASSLPRDRLQPLGAEPLLAKLAAAAGPVSRLYGPPDTAPLAFPWAFSPWVVALRSRPDLIAAASHSWDVLLDPSLRGSLVLPSSPRLSIELMQADPARLRQLRRQALSYDDAQGLNLLLSGDARAAVLPLQRLIPLLRRDPRLAVVMPSQGAPLSWQLLLRPAVSPDPLPLAWLAELVSTDLLPRLLAGGWVPPLPRPELEPALQALPAPIRALLLPSEAVLERCWSLPPLGERQRLAWQTLWDASAP